MGIFNDFGPEWSTSDEANVNFIKLKYAERERLGDEWVEKRKLAEKNKTREDGKPNPHYARMAMEAELARMAFDMAYMVETNCRMAEQIIMLQVLFERVGLIEGNMAYLKQSTDYVKNQYKDSVRKHYEDRKEWSTQNNMRNAGLDPDSKADRLRWAQRIDEITAAHFNHEPKELKNDKGTGTTGEKS